MWVKDRPQYAWFAHLPGGCVVGGLLAGSQEPSGAGLRLSPNSDWEATCGSEMLTVWEAGTREFWAFFALDSQLWMSPCQSPEHLDSLLVKGGHWFYWSPQFWDSNVGTLKRARPQKPLINLTEFRVSQPPPFFLNCWQPFSSLLYWKIQSRKKVLNY